MASPRPFLSNGSACHPAGWVIGIAGPHAPGRPGAHRARVGAATSLRSRLSAQAGHCEKCSGSGRGLAAAESPGRSASGPEAPEGSSTVERPPEHSPLCHVEHFTHRIGVFCGCTTVIAVSYRGGRAPISEEG